MIMVIIFFGLLKYLRMVLKMCHYENQYDGQQSLWNMAIIARKITEEVTISL